ncbi:MAG: histidine utilization repressor [Thermoanaerobaculia bacterium]|nr:histidine utilization repressor [Thermoanaerobaculia bacterium]
MNSAPQPLYRQVKEHVLRQIRSGDWPTGHRVPSENRLVEEFGVSRMTVNRALRELADEGVLRRLQGVGTFVARPSRQTSLVELRDIADEIRSRGRVHRARMTARGRVPTTAVLHQRFEDASLGHLFHLVLVHLENEVPVQIEDRYVHPQVAPQFFDQDFEHVTPTEYLLSITPVSELEHVVRATVPNATERALLELGIHEPCLVVHRRSWSWGRVATDVTLTYPASRYELRGRHRTSPTGTLDGVQHAAS